MAWTQSDIDALKAAIVAGKGARSIAFGDQVITFHSLTEMRDLLADMQADVAITAGTSRSRFAATSKGV
jgi:hypothetical protein